jgi:hypothetical protein
VSCSLRSNTSRHIMPCTLTCVSSRRRGYARKCVWWVTAQPRHNGRREGAMINSSSIPADATQRLHTLENVDEVLSPAGDEEF